MKRSPVGTGRLICVNAQDVQNEGRRWTVVTNTTAMADPLQSFAE